MSEDDNNNNLQKKSALPAETGSAKDDPQPTVPLSLPIDPLVKHHKRSTGLRIFDVVLYPVIANIGVFAISVVATYLTTKGGDKDAAGKLIYGKTGEFFHKRGKWLTDKFQGMGMSKDSAEMSKMVFFSFADGSLMAPLIKLFEDRREKFGRWCDEKLGTTPSDPTVYDKEPKQSWTSVLGGRASTALVVVSTAVALDHKILPGKNGQKISFNDKLFINPGIQLGEWVKTKPKLASMFGKHDVGELGKISIFEAVYTSICTAGLYFSSRLFARGLNKHKENKEAKQHEAAVLASGNYSIQEGVTLEEPARAPQARAELRKPLPASRGASHLERYENSPQEPSLAR